MTEKLIVPGHIADLKYVIPALKVYADANDWLSTADYIDREFRILKDNGVESYKKSDLTDYTKDAELPRYFGFVERKIKGNTQSECRITHLGKKFYDAYVKENKDIIWESIIESLETITFGRNNDGCPNSNSKLEAPNILLISALLLDGITRQEYASVLYKMLYNNDSIIKAVTYIKICRTIDKELGETIRVDNKVIPFLVSLGFLTDDNRKLNISKSVLIKFSDRISKLRTTNDKIEIEHLSEIRNKRNIETAHELFGISNQYRPFITAIKSKPFLLLAGISGTGKSRIVRELARACWDVDSEEYNAQKPKNFEMVQVKPNWHDSSELIGYVSRVSGDPVYVAGDFLKFVAKAWEKVEDGVPYFLCLDEMNLAPVEQYFAEYLSVIESRKADDNGNITTDPILKKSTEDWYRVLTNELTGDDEIRNRFLEDGICIPQNLIVVGTVNMDETTFSFSRKVLDRAMTIEMNEVDLTGGLTKKYEQIGKLGAAELIGNAVEGVDIYSSYKSVCDTAIDYMQKVNDKLESTPFKIAYRTRNEVLLYVVNNLPYNSNEDSDDLKQEYVIARALDEITNMKILSRIEGDETKVSEAFLKDLGKVIKEELEEISDCSFDIEETDDAYKSVSLAKLDEMKKRLDSGYTSFWS